MLRLRSGTRAGRTAFLLVLFVVAVATLFPGSDGALTADWCLLCGAYGAADAIRNVALFVPVGVTAALSSGSFLLAAATAPALSLLVETAQLAIPGRDAGLGDLIFNSIGGLIGVFIAASAPTLLAPGPQAARRLVAAATFAPLLAIGLSGAVLGIVLPPTTYYAQWTPDLGHLELYDGSVFEAKIGKRFIPPQRLQESEGVRQQLLTGAPVELRAIAGPEPAGLAPIFSIYDAHQHEIMVLGATRQTLVFRLGTRAAPLKLGIPALRYPGGLEGVRAGDTLDVRVSSDGDGRCFRIIATAGPRGLSRERCGIGYTVASGWQLLAPPGLGSREPALFDLLWLGILYLPLGYWIRPTGRGLYALAVSALGLLGIPALTALVATPVTAVVAAGAGILAGIGMRRWIAQRLSSLSET